jgi:hypothetical protein
LCSTSRSRPPKSLYYRLIPAGRRRADLVQDGVAKRVAVLTDAPTGEDHEFTRRGLPYDNASAKQIRHLKWLGVTNVPQIPEPTLERKAKARCFRRGATSISSDPVCS